MKTLVTGGAGFIGSHCIGALLERGDTVVCLDNFNDYYPPKWKEENLSEYRENPRFKLVRGDVLDSKLLNELFAMERFDRVLHLAARAGVRASILDPLLYEQVNVHGTLTVLDAARAFSVSQVVVASSSSVYGDMKTVPFKEDESAAPLSPYAVSKRAMELFCAVFYRLHKMPITCLRFFTVYGPRNRPDMAVYSFTKKILSGEMITQFGDGSSYRDYTYIDDIVKGVLNALERPLGYEVINLGNHAPVTLSKLISLLESKLGKKAVSQLSPEVPEDVPFTYADISKAERLLDFHPTTSIEEGIGKFVEWYSTIHAKRYVI